MIRQLTTRLLPPVARQPGLHPRQPARDLPPHRLAPRRHRVQPAAQRLADLAAAAAAAAAGHGQARGSRAQVAGVAVGATARGRLLRHRPQAAARHGRRWLGRASVRDGGTRPVKRHRLSALVVLANAHFGEAVPQSVTQPQLALLLLLLQLPQHGLACGRRGQEQGGQRWVR